MFHSSCINEWGNNAEVGKPIGCPTCKTPFHSVIPHRPLFVDLTVNNQGASTSSGTTARTTCSTSINSAHEATNESAETQDKADPANLQSALEAQFKKETLHEETDGRRASMGFDIRRKKFWANLFDLTEEMDSTEWHPKITVRFVEEAGCDTGGLAREFFSLLYLNCMRSQLLTGKVPFLYLSHDQAALEAGKYEVIGKLTAIALLNGYSGPQCFSETLTDYILNTKVGENVEKLLNEFPDNTCKDKLMKIAECNDTETFKNLISDLDERFDFGYCSSTVGIESKIKLIQSACKHYMVSLQLEETQSYMKGLQLYGVLENLRKFPDCS